MTLPAITLPKVELPFDISVLLHPPVVHFMIALPVVILLLELMNLIMKKKAIGGVSFFLIFLTGFIAVGAYLTGLVDGKEAYPVLTDAAKTALSEHKNLGTYLLLGSGVLFFFKLLSVVIRNSVMKFFYLAVLAIFVYGIFIQAQEGGELVYEHGMNVEKVKTLDDELSDLKEEIEELEEAADKVKESIVVSTPIITVIPVIKKTPKIEAVPVVITPKIEAVVEVPVVQTAEVKIIYDTPVVQIQEETIPTPVETLRTETEEDVAPIIKETVKMLQVEGMPEEMIQPQIATH